MYLKNREGIVKKVYVKPEMEVELFTPNEYVAFCGMTEGGTWLVGNGVIVKHNAYTRFPAGQEGYNGDDRLEGPYTIYEGAFYKNGELDKPDSTHLGHESEEVFDEVVTCVRGDEDGGSKSPWGYHYHFAQVSNFS